MPFSDKEKIEIMQELQDPEAAQRFCATHDYQPSLQTRPVRGCKVCQLCFWLWVFRRIPPSKRREKLEELQELAHHMAELEDKGDLDVRLFPHPVLTTDSAD